MHSNMAVSAQGHFGPCAETSQCHNVSLSMVPKYPCAEMSTETKCPCAGTSVGTRVHVPKRLWYQIVSTEMSLSEMPCAEISSSLLRIPLSRSPCG